MHVYNLVTGLVPEELLPLLLKEAAVDNAEEGEKKVTHALFCMVNE